MYYGLQPEMKLSYFINYQYSQHSTHTQSVN